jgi:hypothetical protein
MRKSSGLSLAETVVGLFLLTFGILVSTRLLDAGLQHQASVERLARATTLAEKSMAQVRTWARTSVPPNSVSSKYNFDETDWSSATLAKDPDYSGFDVAVSVQDLTLFSPCSEFEEPFVSLGEAREMTSSAKAVKVIVTDTSNPRFNVELVSWVTDPTRHLDHVTMASVGGGPPTEFEPAVDIQNPVANSYVEFEAQGHYADGSVVPDLMFDWYTVPLGGNGTVVPSRDGRRARFINGIQMKAGDPAISTAGAAAFVVHGQYRGHGQPPQEWDVLVPNPFIAVDLPVYTLK